jgi:predicted AAA+ superfamily ATPase
MYIKRLLESELRKAAATRPSLILTGARQVGKTTLLRKTFPDAEYVTLDNMLLASSAQEAPQAFLERYKKQTIIDEVQYAPNLFRALKERIDADRDAVGRWLLTGSQRFGLMKGVSESLAGRIAVLHLEPLSAAEIRGEADVKTEGLDALFFRGGYPELWKNREIDPLPWFEDYLRTYLERDLRDLVQVKNLLDFRRFLGILAARAGSLINYNDIARSVGVANNTIKAWVAVLEASGIIHILPPYFANTEKRLIKTPKLYFADCGLLAALLNLRSKDELALSAHAGMVWENFTFLELVKGRAGQPGRDLFFYRDAAGAEVDFLILHSGGPLLIEAKHSSRIRAERLSFQAAEALFPGASPVRRVAAPTGDPLPIPMDGYDLYDLRLA